MRVLIDIQKEPFKLLEFTDYDLKKDEVKNFQIQDKEKIIEYMRKSEYLSILLDSTNCIFTGEIIEHFDTHKTDGKWIWSADIIHYIEKHNFILPLDFLSDIRQNDYKTYKLTDEIYKNLHEKIYTKGYLNVKMMSKYPDHADLHNDSR
jgi:hypothetical protein